MGLRADSAAGVSASLVRTGRVLSLGDSVLEARAKVCLSQKHGHLKHQHPVSDGVSDDASTTDSDAMELTGLTDLTLEASSAAAT